MDCQWVEGYGPCLDKSILAANRGGGKSLFTLQSITCVQYAPSEDCLCQMDCLLSFHGAPTIGSDGYAFVGSISCDTSQLDEVKTFFFQPDANVTFIGGPSLITSCYMTGQIVGLNACCLP